jgi:SAM-dependent methyltransferase
VRPFGPEGPTLAELARQGLSSTRRGYDLLAPRFDRTPFRTPELLLRALAPLLGAPASVERGLDLCCGTGAALRWLRPVCRERVVGVDFSVGMLAEARRRLEPRGGAKVDLVCRDVLELDFDAAFQLATWFGAWGHVRPRDQPRLMTQIARALEPGGRLITVARPWPRPWRPGLWLALLFDGVMWLRNRALPRRPFVMYYTIFMLPRAQRLLTDAGLRVELVDPRLPGPFGGYRVLVATR